MSAPANEPPPPRPSGETSLHVRRAKHGDEASLAWIVGRLSPLLLAQARFRLSPALRAHVDPDDLVQEVWTVALPAIGGLGVREGRETPVLLRFLSTTLLHRLANLTRKHIRARTAPSPTDDASSSSAPLGALAAETVGELTRVARREADGELARAIDELPERDREVVVLRGIEGHPNGRVAELVGDSPNAVSLRYSRALKALRERLGPGVLDELGPENLENP